MVYYAYTGMIGGICPMKKMSALLLWLALSLFFFPVCAETEGDFSYAVSDSKAAITAYTGSADHLIVPDTLGGYPVTSIRYCAFRGCTSLVTVVLPDSLTAIGSNAFQNCFSLTQLDLPESLSMIGTHAFYGCARLAQLTIPDGLGRIHPYAFYGCSAVRLCSLSSQAALTLTCFGYAFTSPDYPQLSLKAYQNDSGERTFTVVDCDESAVSVVFPEGVTAIGRHAFNNCTALTELAIPESVTEIAESAFEGCPAR